MSSPTSRWITCCLAVAGSAAALFFGPICPALSQEEKPAPAPAQVRAQAQAPAPSQAPALRPGFPDLVKGLKETPGCLGVETARSASGKNVIFAWFENKAAVSAWYKSGIHRSVMKLIGPGPTNPLKYVPDDSGPILIIASITMAEKPRLEGTEMPISQIAVEIYQPLPGGASIGGTFAPTALKIPHHRRYEDDAIEPDAQGAAAGTETPKPPPASEASGKK
jgi:hypothetical protein